MLEQGDKFIVSEKLNPKNVNRVKSIARVREYCLKKK